MRKNIVAGNWKMNTTVPEGVQLAKDVCAAVAAEANLKCDVIMGVPFTHLMAVKEVIGDATWAWLHRTAPTTPAVPTPVRFRLPW